MTIATIPNQSLYSHARKRGAMSIKLNMLGVPPLLQVQGQCVAIQLQVAGPVVPVIPAKTVCCIGTLKV